jgi:VIT1/CCC1 family predicted Fe2+/Mn2+ transporter
MKNALKIAGYIVGGLILVAAYFAFPTVQIFVIGAFAALIGHTVLTTIIEAAVTKVVQRELGNMRKESFDTVDRLKTIELQNDMILNHLRRQ